MIADRIIELAKETAATMSAKEFIDGQRALGRRVTVSVEVYDTKGTSKRGHAATFSEAVEQVRGMLGQETISSTENEGTQDVGAIAQEGREGQDR